MMLAASMRLTILDHCWKQRRPGRVSSRLGRSKQEELLDGVIKTSAQLAQMLAIVLETEAQHLRDRDDVLADGDLAQDLLVDVLGEEQGALLMA